MVSGYDLGRYGDAFLLFSFCRLSLLVSRASWVGEASDATDQ